MNKRDYYEILNVSRDAGDDEIKKANEGVQQLFAAKEKDLMTV